MCFVLEILCFLSFVNMERSKRTTSGINHLCSSTKKQAIKQKRYDIIIENFLSNSISNLFKFIMRKVGKTYDLRRRNGTVTCRCRKTKDCRHHTRITYVIWALKVSRLMVTYMPVEMLRCNVWSKYSLFMTPLKIPRRLLYPVKSHSLWFGIIWHFFS